MPQKICYYYWIGAIWGNPYIWRKKEKGSSFLAPCDNLPSLLEGVLCHPQHLLKVFVLNYQLLICGGCMRYHITLTPNLFSLLYSASWTNCPNPNITNTLLICVLIFVFIFCILWLYCYNHNIHNTYCLINLLQQ